MIYSSEQYLDDCLRLRGGIAPDEHTNRAVREVLSDLAAARREVETVTKERDRYRDLLADQSESSIAARVDAANERKRREAAEDERDAAVADLTAENETLVQDLATSRAALEDVRGILRTIADMWDDEKAMHEISATAYEMSNIARNALAQEAGDGHSH